MKRTGQYKKCPICENTFYAPRWVLIREGGKYCNKYCYYKSKLGITPWNKGTIGLSSGNTGSFSSAEKAFKGTVSDYKRIHYLVRKEFGNPTVCSSCGVTGEKIQWANRSGNYNLDINEWLPLCKKCHFVYDKVETRRVKNAGN